MDFKMNMFYNGSDTVIAKDIEDAKRVWSESCGEDWDSVSYEYEE
jgi:hypothetical protein